jgi:hypothetical protein
MIVRLVVAMLVLGLSGSVWAQQRKPCEELKAEIDAKIRKNGIDMFTLDVVEMDAQVVEGSKVVGTCDGQTRKIVYKRA